MGCGELKVLKFIPCMVENWMEEGEIIGVLKSNHNSVQSNRASSDITGSTMRTRSRDDAQQIYESSTGERFFSSVPYGVFNLLSSFTNLEES